MVLGTATTDANGGFTKQVTIPATLAAGQHNLVASGVDTAGNIHQIRMPVTITVTSTSSGHLPVTGAPITGLANWAGNLIITAGIGLVAYGTRQPRTR